MTKIPMNKPEPGSVRDHQAAATVMLGRLLMADLPPLIWAVRPFLAFEPLNGQLFGDDDTRQRAMDAWAAFLRVEVQTTTADDHVELAIETVRDGVPIRIWGYLKATFTYVKTPITDAKGGASDE